MHTTLPNLKHFETSKANNYNIYSYSLCFNFNIIYFFNISILMLDYIIPQLIILKYLIHNLFLVACPNQLP